MPSTYSTDLRINLLGTGDAAGTWGSTTNNNFQYIFEQAIAGVQTVSVTATPQALTYLNGATATLANNQAIAAALIFTNGGVNANFTITTPSGSQKLYIIYNNTSYVATIQVTSSSGSTVAIPAGVTTTVYTDGTNFYAANTGSVGAYGINGALTVTGNASVGGNQTITGTLAVTGTTTLTGAAALNGGGTSTTPSPSTDNSTKIATTAFVQSVAGAVNSVMSGTIQMWPTSSAPTGYLVCDGTAVSRTTYSALFAIVGTVFGGGDGSSTFNLPNYKDRMPIGVNSIAASVGATGGSSTTTLITANLPSHSHAITDPGHYHYVGSNDSTAQDGGSPNQEFVRNYNAGNGPATYTNTQVTGITGTNSTGSGTAATTISPYLGIYFIIKT